MTLESGTEKVPEINSLGVEVRRWPIMAVVIATIFGIVFWASIEGPMRTAFDGVQQAPTPPANATIPVNLPTVEPLVLKELPPDTARRINAATPFTRAPIPPARPFYGAGSALDQERATDCLAAAILYEAGTEPLAGRKAVAQVVLNRVRHPAFPKSICGVVFQGAARRTGCQFTFTCDGAMARLPSAESWANARGLARIMLTGEVYRPVGTATHYHTDWVLPAWSGTLDKIHKEGSHLFFRWTGWWGTLSAFRARYSGMEPLVPQLVRISAAHSGGANGILLPSEADLTMPGLSSEIPTGLSGDGGDDLPANPYGITPVYRSAKADQLIFVIPRQADPSLMLSLVLISCSVKPYCKVMIWTDAKLAPTKMPANEDQLQAMVFSYLRNRSAGIDKALWNCNLFPRPDASQCMKPRSLTSPSTARSASRLPVTPPKAP